MIGLIAAEKAETSALIKKLKAKIIEFNGIKYYIGNIADKQVVIAYSGIGKVNAAMTAMNMVINFGVTKIFNIGLCGSCKQTVIPGSILIADAVEYNDVDLTAFNYPLNQLPEEPIKYEVKQEDIRVLKTLIPDGIIGTIATGDSVVSIKNVEMFPSLANQRVVGFDMEAAAIAHVCHKTNVDFLSVKIVSDNLLYNIDSRIQYDNNYKSQANQIEEICISVLEYYSK